MLAACVVLKMGTKAQARASAFEGLNRASIYLLPACKSLYQP